MKHLVMEKAQPADATVSDDTSGTARLLMKVMTKKLNEKYNSVLNEQQKSLIKAYAYSTASEDQTSIRMKLQEIKTGLIDLINSYETEANEYLKNKLQETKSTLLSENLDLVDDEMVTRFMLYSKLRDELESKE
jgi:hypothetical protein